MNNKIEKKLPIYYWLVITALMLLLIFFFYQSQFTKSSELKSISQHITELKNLDASANNALIQNNIHTVRHYDFLIQSIDMFEEKSHHFLEKFSILKH